MRRACCFDDADGDTQRVELRFGALAVQPDLGDETICRVVLETHGFVVFVGDGGEISGGVVMKAHDALGGVGAVRKTASFVFVVGDAALAVDGACRASRCNQRQRENDSSQCAKETVTEVRHVMARR